MRGSWRGGNGSRVALVDELWRPVVGYDGWYEVSTRGGVRSVDRVVVASNGKRRAYPGVELAQRTMPAKGYRTVGLKRNGTEKRALVHRLVLESFVGPAPAGHECCHEDGDPGNNSLGNLRWDTKSANVRDQVRHGTHHRGRRTECPRGHALVEPNLVRGHLARGMRECRACGQARSAVQKRPSLVFETMADEKYARIMGALTMGV